MLVGTQSLDSYIQDNSSPQAYQNFSFQHVPIVLSHSFYNDLFSQNLQNYSLYISSHLDAFEDFVRYAY